MSDLSGGVPHFLRVVRALANVRSPLPVLAAVTTVVAGVHCAKDMGSAVNSPCQTDADCSMGEVCISGSCGACLGICIPSCTSDADCPQGETCDTTTDRCVLPPCTSDADCPQGDTCDTTTGLCISAGCTSDADCPTGQACDTATGTCMEVGGTGGSGGAGGASGGGGTGGA